MSNGTARALGLVALAQWLFFVACLAASLRLLALAHALTLDFIVLEAGFFCFATMGTFIASRRPTNLIGWLFAAIGLGTAITSFESAYAAYAADVLKDVNAPVFRVLDWLGNCVWPLNLGLGVFILLLFPAGRLPSHRWRVVAWIAAVGVAGQVIAAAFMPGRFSGEKTTNPFGIPSAAPVLTDVNNLTGVLFVLAALLSVICVILRFLRSRGEQRQQLKWFAYGVIMAMLILFISFILLPESVGNIAFAIAFALIPAGAGIAILRYRLYDIDVIIRRTLVYGSLTAILAGVYFAVVIGMQQVVGAVTGNLKLNPLMIVLSTLLIAGLFTPLRKRIQQFIDRRFYRANYDAAHTLEHFAATLRGETDLPHLADDLVRIVGETLHPAHISLWLRPLDRREP